VKIGAITVITDPGVVSSPVILVTDVQRLMDIGHQMPEKSQCLPVFVGGCCQAR
jgi:hypothetical protein